MKSWVYTRDAGHLYRKVASRGLGASFLYTSALYRAVVSCDSTDFPYLIVTRNIYFVVRLQV